MSAQKPLKVWVDGELLADPDARAMWKRFSTWMDQHAGDLAGFARSEGFASVHPEIQAGSPALITSHTAAQRPYAPAPSRPPSAKRKRR